MKKLVVIITMLTGMAGNAQPKLSLRQPDDKDLHKITGIAISTGVSSLMYVKTKRPGISLLAGFGAAAGAGIGKEVVWDNWMHRGVPSFMDGAATVFGACTGVMVEAIVIHFRRQRQMEREVRISRLRDKF